MFMYDEVVVCLKTSINCIATKHTEHERSIAGI